MRFSGSFFCEYNQHDRESELSNRPTEINELVWIRLTLLGRRNRRSARLDRRHLPGMPARCQVDPPKPRYLLPTHYGVASATRIIRAVSRPLASAASTVPMSRPRESASPEKRTAAPAPLAATIQTRHRK
jgi:hypothetical protein